MSEASERERERGIQLRRFFIKLFRALKRIERFLRAAIHRVSLQIELVSFFVRCGPLFDSVNFVRRKFRFQLACDLLRKRALDCEHVCEIAVVLLCPNVAVVKRIDQLHYQTHAIAGSSHAALQYRRDSQFLCDGANVVSFGAVLHDRRAGDYFQVLDPGQRSEHIIVNAVGEMLVVFFLTKIVEGKNRDRFIQW